MGKKTKILLLIFALLLCSALIATTYGQRRYPVLGREMITNITLLEDHREALEHWRTKGFRNAILINIDAHDDLKRVPKGQLAGIEQTPTGLANGNFIHAAAKQGIVSRVIWVVPSTYEIFGDNGLRLQSLLRSYGFSEQDITTFCLKDGSFSGTSANIPVTVCDLASLPDLRQPVLLSFDADYFPAMLTPAQLKIIDALKQTFFALYQKGYSVMDATVAYSINGGYLDSSRRWVGDLIVDSLRIPGLVSLPAMTRRYEFLQGTDLLMRMGRYDELLKDLVNIPPEEEREPVLLLYAAKAYQQSGNLSQAFRYAETACLRDRRYCSAFAEIGASLLEKRGLAAAEPFFRRGYELNPRMDNGQFRYAMALSRVGRYDDAIRYFHIFRNGYGVFPVDFYLAKASQMKGDDATAKLYYDSALAELMKNQELMGGFGDVSVLEKGALFYDSHGESGSAKLLRQLAKKREIELDAPMEPLLY